MKRFITSLLWVFSLSLFSINAQDKIDADNRVTLVAAQIFDEILVNGDITVECQFKPELHRYIVYNTTENTDKRIICHNDSNRLIINGDNQRDMVASRIVVFCNDSLKAVIMNGSGNILIKETPRLKRFHIIQNANGAIKIGNLQSHFLSIVNNGPGSILTKEVKARRLSMLNNGNGELKFKSIKAFNGTFILNSNTNVAFDDILVRKASFITNGNGSFSLKGKTNELTLTSNNAGNIDASELSHKTIISSQSNSSGYIKTKK